MYMGRHPLDNSISPARLRHVVVTVPLADAESGLCGYYHAYMESDN
jgi:hypothetical protein